ncbi:hypothetical protein F2P81_004779 [Scophthalmus maximus]|uniref:Uncharacterized protein n=1 Tax=Scophthalmus maximus TaxID=52904 RepID=A0A6A4TN74_SCOMX|nr:hypothetical protein F2P81_004779 [Scophthalmus maximus]
MLPANGALSGTILQHSQKKDDAKANVTSTEVEQISLTDRDLSVNSVPGCRHQSEAIEYRRKLKKKYKRSKITRCLFRGFTLATVLGKCGRLSNRCVLWALNRKIIKRHSEIRGMHSNIAPRHLSRDLHNAVALIKSLNGVYAYSSLKIKYTL